MIDMQRRLHVKNLADLDPGFALPYVGMANAYSVRTDLPADEAEAIAMDAGAVPRAILAGSAVPPTATSRSMRFSSSRILPGHQ